MSIKSTSKILVCVFLSVVLILSGFTYVFAADRNSDINAQRELQFVYISSVLYDCSISGASIRCLASMSTESNMNISISMELQKFKSGTYDTIKTWNASVYGSNLDMNESRLINIFSTYRLKVTFTAATETITRYAYP
ncbi:MAG: hypothetical protein IJS90_02875 [Clostridia bacterium]|nr:hypothetical protein [Clostridia bacterium]